MRWAMSRGTSATSARSAVVNRVGKSTVGTRSSRSAAFSNRWVLWISRRERLTVRKPPRPRRAVGSTICVLVNDQRYLDWAIKQMVCWDQDEPIPNAIHIHGEKDAIFPHSCVNDCISVKGGTHIMIINKYKWFNENLPNLILGHPEI